MLTNFQIMSKFAYITYTVNKLGQNPSLGAIGLRKLEEALARWIENRQMWPLAYDPVWGGIVSTASFEGRDSGYDFGGTYYNDHHFHYGYFVHAASIVAYLHPDWLKMGNNKVWVDTLIRDYANSDVGDPYFPPSRAFDYFNGHSWATGIFSSPDGKNEESTSEDAFAAYAMKMWGHVTGDPNMEARGNLQLAIMKNSFSNYFYYSPDNAVQPATFARNVVSGILFENKLDHSTFFGNRPEFVQGIHMLPVSPITSYIRPNTFVAYEWATYFQSQIPLSVTPDPVTGVIPAIGTYGGGYNCSERTGMSRLINCASPEWKGLLIGNIAQVDPTLAWDYFANVGGAMHGGDGFDWRSVTGSGSRTWYLAYAAAFRGLFWR
jgi:endo-1,3(4)-beta-glucanase